MRDEQDMKRPGWDQIKALGTNVQVEVREPLLHTVVTTHYKFIENEYLNKPNSSSVVSSH
jgi:hypothetical protein